jgi:hypothetical protein
MCFDPDLPQPAEGVQTNAQDAEHTYRLKFTAKNMERPEQKHGAGSSDATDPLVHNIAIGLSRALNIINPNDLLARRVMDIARNNTQEGFMKGTS